MGNIGKLAGALILAGGAAAGIAFLSGGESKVNHQEISSAISDLESRFSEINSKMHNENSDPSEIKVKLLNITMEDYHQQIKTMSEIKEAKMKEALNASAVVVNELTKLDASSDPVDESTILSTKSHADSKLNDFEASVNSIIDFQCEAGIANNNNKVVCFTKNRTHPNEVLADTIPENKRIRKVLRCNYNGQGMHAVLNESARDPVNGAIILDHNVVLDISTNNVSTDMEKNIISKCCATCEDNCWVSPGNWGMCPYCLCDNSCKDYCIKSKGNI